MHLFYHLIIIETALAILYLCHTSKMTIRGQRIYLILAFFVIYIFHAFREPTSLADIPQYKLAYGEALKYTFSRVVSEGFVSLKSELGFRVIIKIISEIFSSYVWLFLITSGIIIYSFYNATKKYSPIYWLSVMLFVVSHFANSLFMLRAFFAIAVLLFSFPYIIERKIVPFLILTALAMSCHMTAVIFLPVYFIYGVKNKVVLTLTLLVLGFALLFTFTDVVNYMVERLFPGYAYYIQRIDNYEGASWKVPAMMGAVLLLRILVLRKHFFDEGITRLLSILCVLAFVIYTSGMGFGLTSRMAMFYTNMTFLILPNTCYRIKNKAVGYSIAIFYVIFNGYFFLNNSLDELWRNYRLYDFI